MGGVDITSQAFSGTKTNLKRSVTYNLSNCYSTTDKQAVINGQMFYTEIVAAAGYTLVAQRINHNGSVDVSTYYSDGRIVIPNVTGNVVINVSAVSSAKENLLTMNDGNINKRIKSDGSLAAQNGYFVNRLF
jgi:hypothetical protein